MAAKNICHISVYGDIVSFQSEDIQEFGCVSLTTVKAAFDQNPDCDEIVVHIHSPGGSFYEGFAIHDFLVGTGKTITTIVEGMCASIATVIFLAGESRKLSANSRFLIHNPFQYCEGNAAELQKIAAELAEEQNRMLEFYVEKTGSDPDTLQALMDEDKVIDADAALELKFATEIVDPVKAMSAHQKNEILNSIKQKSQNMEKSKKDKLQGLIASFKKTAKELLALDGGDEPKAGSVKLADDAGDLFFEGETIAEGTAVFSDAEMTTAATDGDHTAENGDVITVADGVVSAIVAFVEASETDAEKIARLEGELSALKASSDEAETLLASASDTIEEQGKVLAKMKSTWQPAARTTQPGKTTKVVEIKAGEKGSLKAAIAEEKKKIAEAKAKK